MLKSMFNAATGSTAYKIFHHTCIAAMVLMTAAHGGTFMMMASNFLKMHILPGIAAAPLGLANIGSAGVSLVQSFAGAAAMTGAPAMIPMPEM